MNRAWQLFEAILVIEPQVIARDKERDETMQRHGYEVLRFEASDVMRAISAVLLRIWRRCDARAAIPPKHFVRGKDTSRFHANVEFEALRAEQDCSRRRKLENKFCDDYRKRRELPVNKRKRGRRSAWWKSPQTE